MSKILTEEEMDSLWMGNFNKHLIKPALSLKAVTKEGTFEFDSGDIEININYSNDLELEMNIPDSPDGAYLELYALGLHKNQMPNKKSLIYFNNPADSDEGIILEDCVFCDYPGYDIALFLDLKKINFNYDRIIFIIGRPMAGNATPETWICEKSVKDAIKEVCCIDCLINESSVLKNIKYQYNKFGAMSLFELKKTKDFWKLNVRNDVYKNGLKEIIDKHYANGTNKT